MEPPRAVACVDCGERAATVFLSKVIDGTMVQRNLCAHCARATFNHPPPAPPPVTFLSPPSINPDFLARPKDCPAEIEIAGPVTVLELAAKLRVKPFHVIAVLVTHNVFITGKEPIDMDTTAVVCRHYGVTLHEVTPETEGALSWGTLGMEGGRAHRICIENACLRR